MYRFIDYRESYEWTSKPFTIYRGSIWRRLTEHSRTIPTLTNFCCVQKPPPICKNLTSERVDPSGQMDPERRADPPYTQRPIHPHHLFILCPSSIHQYVDGVLLLWGGCAVLVVFGSPSGCARYQPVGGVGGVANAGWKW